MTEFTIIESDLCYLLESNEVQSIETTVFIEANPFRKDLPEQIHHEAEELLKKLRGRVFPIALRGNSQVGKSTTLNRIAKLTKYPLENPLPVGENCGSTTTYGIWLMIITFKNQDALLLFDVQGVGHGNDEMTYKLIAFTDHVCTKVIDVFRMPYGGFSNEYIDSLYYLANAQNSVKNLTPACNKVILWTDCVLPKRNPSGTITCNEPREYHDAIVDNATSHRKIQTEMAKKYTEGTPILTTRKFEDNITPKISQLENDNPLIKDDLIPVVKTILSDVQPAMIGSCEIRGTDQYIDYLERIYSCIIKSNIDLPFCQSELIRNIVNSNVKERKEWIREQLDNIKLHHDNDFDWIENNAKNKIDNTANECIEEFQRKLECFDEVKWKDGLDDLKVWIQLHTKQLLDTFKNSFTDQFIEKKYLELHQLCKLGHKSDVLENELNKKFDEILIQFNQVPLFIDEIDNAEKIKLKQTLKARIDELITIEKDIENYWLRKENEFKTNICKLDETEVEQSINTILDRLDDFIMEKFSKFNICAKLFFDRRERKGILKRQYRSETTRKVHELQNTHIYEFTSYADQVLSSITTEQNKYAQLLDKQKECEKKYWFSLHTLKSHHSACGFNKLLKTEFDKALDQIYTPQVLQKLKEERMAQMKYTAKFTANDKESWIWFHCVYCQRIYAGRISKGCSDVFCNYEEQEPYVRGNQKDYVCGKTFNMKKAKLVDFSTLPEDFWLSSTETRVRSESQSQLRICGGSTED